MFEDIILDYRDPAVGVIAIFLLIFVVSSITYTVSIYNERKSRKEYRKLLKRFELGTLKEDDYIHLYTTYNLPFDSIILLASSFLHKGQQNKAISVYLALLEHVKEPIKKEELLELLGEAYFKSGMLQRSKDIFLKILKFSPRNKIALHKLLLIFQQLNEFNRADEVLDALDELDEEIEKERVYLQVLKTINDSIMSFEKKSSLLLQKFKVIKKLERIVAEFLIKFNKELFWENIHLFDVMKVIDLLWYLDFEDIDWDSVNKDKRLTEIYTAKGYIKTSKMSDVFELNVLIALKNSTVPSELDLNFEFICQKCKVSHPIYESRCPHCENTLSFMVEPRLGKATLSLASLV
ncbi:MAG: tetratricopeptide repeat protein [Arcobacteraceae bacterium]